MLAPPEPLPHPAEATCDFPFWDPLEAELEKVVFTKNVALAMLYLVLFENLKNNIQGLSFYFEFLKSTGRALQGLHFL